MTLHREGKGSIIIALVLFLIINFVSYKYLFVSIPVVFYLLLAVTLVLLLLVISFFRIPARQFTIDNNAIIAPCDGKVVVIETVQADEYFTDKRVQVSIFMSPLNVHVNRNPVSGEVVYNQYHKGKYLVAWHPKSSTENERHTNVYRVGNKEVLTKQIAGALAKRIVNYLAVGTQAKQAGEMGFIKFGSRVDLLLPLDAKVQVNIGDVAVGGKTVIATW
ncbi:MAG TPA: phosphatidylserine decarboxylase family protein [Niabella sp.]|nr:phosphatidylserine decarboxylase family protein [Niabella sp.]HOZ96549.1 phosphatidylserine decarboxylase family protein [Niabella sp.]HQW13270.1 phosphatidylserine decarboxylase family protein [Niabella sp.]HQX18690.1 phosphatidylserine decarboxylase family protein [Niabella sp.]HQX40343.1 phosphatidylserine decarboxylase family protein [Niabella sp.]